MMTTPPLTRLAPCQRLGQFLLVLGCVVYALGVLPTAQAQPLAQTPPQYIVTDLGTLGGPLSFAIDLNNRGQVIGPSWLAGGEIDHSFVWQAGEMTDLGPIGRYNSPRDINEAGQILGEYYTEDRRGGFVWQNGVITDLGSLGGCCDTGPLAINEQGQAIGYSTTPSGAFHAFLWQDGVMTDLGTLGSEYIGSFAWDINNRGQIVGASFTADGESHAFLWQNGVMTDLGTLGSEYISSSATAINERGQIVGTSITPDINNRGSGEQHGFLWQDGVMTDLGWLGGYDSFVSDINEQGQIIATDSNRYGLLWQNGVMTNLGNLGDCCNNWVTEINEQGQIVGTSAVADGSPHAFVWQDGVMTDLGPICGQIGCGSTVHINERGQIAATINDHATLWTPRGATAREQISALQEQLVDLMSYGILNQSQYQALAVKLEAALEQLAQHRPSAAANQLRAFVHQVDAFQQTGVLSQGQAQWLRAPANMTIAELT